MIFIINIVELLQFDQKRFCCTGEPNKVVSECIPLHFEFIQIAIMKQHNLL